MPQLSYTVTLDAPAAEVFTWHEQPDALIQLNPPSPPVKILSQTGPISQPGAKTTLEIKLFGILPLRWVAEHTGYVAGEWFEDIQRQGPFARWQHVHRVVPVGDHQCELRDEIIYTLPLSPLSDWVAGWWVRHQLDSLFAYRHNVLKRRFSATPST